MALYRTVPLTLLPFLLFNSIHYYFGGQSQSVSAGLGATVPYDPFEEIHFAIELISGAEWKISGFDLLIAFGLVCVFFEILKAAGNSRMTIVDHILSAFVFISYLVEFFLIEAAANSAFFILGLIAFLDVIAGFSISIYSARRDVIITYDD